MWRCLTFLCGLIVAPAAQAHPHVFVDVTLTLETDAEGRVDGVEVTWVYDPLFTMLVLSDRGLDSDADLSLTDDEKAALLGFDLQDWPEGFDGALFAYDEDGAVTLGPAEALSVGMRDGALVTRHRRPVAALEIGAGEVLRLEPYDPYYYAALSLVQMDGLPEGCAARIVPPDKEAADARVAEMGNSDDEMFFEEAKVGVHYAFSAEVTCVGS
ncbi:hypothetical protein XM53_11385 [Roseovarius atlanticus]|uniref:Polyphosphate kinase n=1 Tax=Roseovarius atlanticus TaxID=1641875 RepID=A0A0T5NTV6_9RHOB|nr:DUF1007 family protein [Roseovarius atlanticus]KRS12252.1 hypothetical protein XM53_11385 [Roseovarius atlanticus]